MNRETTALLSDASTPVESIKPKYYNGLWRWVVLFSVSVLSVSNAMQWIAMSPIQDIAEQYWDVSSLAVNSLSTMYTVYICWLLHDFSISFMVVYIPLWPLAAWSLDVKGLRFGVH